MRFSSKATVEFDLKRHYELRDKYLEELKLRDEYKGTYLMKSNERNGMNYYRVKYPGSTKYTYLGNTHNEVINGVREYMFYRKALEVVEKNIEVMECFVTIYRSTRAVDINELLKRVYTLPPGSKVLADCAEEDRWLEARRKEKSRYPVFDPAGLKVEAFDGTKVRSRAEALLYEAFFIYGIPYVFEYPYKIGDDLYRPDFTLLDTYAKAQKMWEHLGNWFHVNAHKQKAYRAESVHRWDEYAKIGYFPEHNLLLSFERPNADLDVQAFHRKVAMLAAPLPDLDTIEMLRRQ